MSENTKILYAFDTTDEDGNDNIAHDILARYEVHELPNAISNLFVVGYTKDGRKVVNPWSVRPVIRRLLNDLDKSKSRWNKIGLNSLPDFGKKVLWQTIMGAHLFGCLNSEGYVISRWESDQGKVDSKANAISNFVAWMEIEKYEEKDEQ